jgi:hypothetical protein
MRGKDQRRLDAAQDAGHEIAANSLAIPHARVHMLCKSSRKRCMRMTNQTSNLGKKNSCGMNMSFSSFLSQMSDIKVGCIGDACIHMRRSLDPEAFL